MAQNIGNGSTKPVMDKKMLALLLSQAARINSHLEEMGHRSSDIQNFLILEECRHELSEIRAALLAGMRGRSHETPDLMKAFTKASKDKDRGDKDSGDSEGRNQIPEPGFQRLRNRKRNRDPDRER